MLWHIESSAGLLMKMQIATIVDTFEHQICSQKSDRDVQRWTYELGCMSRSGWLFRVALCSSTCQQRERSPPAIQSRTINAVRASCTAICHLLTRSSWEDCNPTHPHAPPPPPCPLSPHGSFPAAFINNLTILQQFFLQDYGRFSLMYGTLCPIHADCQSSSAC